MFSNNIVVVYYIIFFLLKDMTDHFCIVLYNIFWEKITMSYVCVDSLIDMFPFLTADFCGMCASVLYIYTYRITALFPHYIIIILVWYTNIQSDANRNITKKFLLKTIENGLSCLFKILQEQYICPKYTLQFLALFISCEKARQYTIFLREMQETIKMMNCKNFQQ